MLRELASLPGVIGSALMGDLLLLGGDRQGASRVYLEAWERGDATALLGYLALEGTTTTTQTLERIGGEIAARARAGDLTPQRASELLRVVVALITVVRRDVERGCGVALRAKTDLPESSALLSPRSAQVQPTDWLRVLSALWQRLKAEEDPDRRGYLILTLSWLASVRGLGEIERDNSLLESAARGGTGTLLYLVLRRLDGVVEWTLAPRASADFRHGIGSAPDATGETATVAREQVAVYLQYLAETVTDRREEAIFRARYADWLWCLGDHQTATEIYELLAGQGPTPVADLARERLQRLHVARGMLGEAARIAVTRADRCDDPQLRVALLLLSMEYLQRAQATPDVYVPIARRLVGLDARGRNLPKAPFRHAFEVVESVLLETGQFDELEDLWRQTGAGFGASTGLVANGDRPERSPDRQIEHLMMLWSRGEAPPPSFSGGRLLRTLGMVRALAAGKFDVALARLGRGGAETDSERLLWSAIVLQLSRGGDEQITDEMVDDARRYLSSRIGAYPRSGDRDLLPFYVLRQDLKLRGELHAQREMFERVLQTQPPQVQALLRVLFGRDLLEAGFVADALELARAAFVVDPRDVSVRALLEETARRTGATDVAELLHEYAGDRELHGLLDGDVDLAARYDDAQTVAAEDPQEASARLLIMGRGLPPGPAKAGLLRRAAELVWRRLDDPEHAVDLALEAVDAHSEDLLAVRTALDLLVGLRWDERTAQLLERVPDVGRLPEQTALTLLDAGRTQWRSGHPDVARRLLCCALLALPRAEKLLATFEALDALEELARGGGLWWPEFLEELLEREVAESVTTELHLRLGRVHEATDRERAISAYRKALVGDRCRGEALRALERLFSEAERYDELAEILRVQAADVVGDGDDARHRKAAYLEALAYVLVDHLSMADEARDLLEQVGALTPRNLDALLKLADIEGALGRFENQVGTLEAAARLVEDQADRSELYHDIGGVYERLDQPTLGLEAYMVSFICNNRNVRTFRRLEHLYSAFGRWKELVGIYEVAIDAVRQEPGCGYDLEQLYARKSQVLFYHLERHRDAAQSLLEALRIKPLEERYPKLMEAMLSGDQAPEILVESYRLRAAALPTDHPERRALLYKLAGGLDRVGARHEESIAIYRQILASWPQDHRAAERVESLLKHLERWDELVAFYRERLNDAGSKEESVPLHWAIAQVAERKLHNVDLAVRTYEAILEQTPDDVDVLRSLSRLFEATKRWDRLIEVSRWEVRLTPEPHKQAHVFFKMGSIHETVHQDVEAAVECYESAVELDPKCVPALHGLREIHRRRGDWLRVIDTLKREADLWSDDRERASVHTMIADVYRDRLKDNALAERHVREAIKLADDYLGARRRLLDLEIEGERWLEAAALVRELVDEASGTDREVAELHVLRANISSRLGEHGVAIDALRTAVELAPSNMEAVEGLLGAVETLGDAVGEDMSAVLADVAQRLEALGPGPGLVRLRIHHGRMAAVAGDVDSALAFFDAAVGLAPLSLEAHLPYLDLLHRLRRFEAEAEQLDALERRLGDAQEVTVRAEVLAMLGDLRARWMDDPAAAVTAYGASVRLRPDGDVLFRKAQAHWLADEFPEAAADVRESLTLGETAERLFYLGRIASHGLGDAETALDAWARARILDPTDLRAALAATEVLRATGRWNDLEHLLRELVDGPGIAASVGARLRLTLAILCSDRGDLGGAETEYQAVISAAPPGSRLMREARLGLAEVYGQLEGGANRAVPHLARLLDEDPADVGVVRRMASLYLDRGDRGRVYATYRYLDALDAAQSGELAFMRSCEKSHPILAHPPTRALEPTWISSFVHDEMLADADAVGIAPIADLLAHAFPTDVHVERGPEGEPLISALAAQVVHVLGEGEWSGRLRARDQGPGLPGIHFAARAVVPKGPRVPVARVLLDSDAIEAGGRSVFVARFLVAKAAEHLRCGLGVARALSLPDLGHVIEVVHRVHAGHSLDDLRAVAHCAHIVAALEQVGLRERYTALAAAVRPIRKAKIPSQAEARVRAGNLLDALELSTDRVGLIVSGDLAAAIDTVVALDGGTTVGVLTGAQRREAITDVPRVRALVRYFLADHHHFVRKMQGLVVSPPRKAIAETR